MQRNCERLAGQLERRSHERRSVPVGREGAKDERCLGRAQLGGETLPRSQRLAGTEQFEGDREAIRAGRDEQELSSADALCDRAHRRRAAQLDKILLER